MTHFALFYFCILINIFVKFIKILIKNTLIRFNPHGLEKSNKPLKSFNFCDIIWVVKTLLFGIFFVLMM